MNYARIARQLSSILGLVTLLLLVPFGMAIVDGDVNAIRAYGITAIIYGIAVSILRFSVQEPEGEIHRKEALLVVPLTWVILGIGGAIPFYLEGSIPSFAAAVFEAVSGFTTAGATVVSDVDNLSRATNLWRALCHWIGGMGIIVLFIAVFPNIGVGAKQFFNNESAGPTSSNMTPRIRETAGILWWTYLLLTICCVTILKVLGMEWFDAVCHGMSAMSTGGFSTKTASVGHFQNPAIEWTICFFMLLAATNFGLLIALWSSRGKSLLNNSEFRFFISLNIFTALVIVFGAYDSGISLHDNVRSAVFQTLIVSSTTGFMTADFDTYPTYAKMLLFICMFIGGCAGSTSGGLKAIRVVMIGKTIIRSVRNYVYPNQVIAVRLDGKKVNEDVLHSVMGYFGLFMFVFFIGSFLVSLFGYDFMDAMGSVIACMASIGPAFNSFGPTQNYAHAPDIVQLILSFCMIAGRLEIIVLLAPFTPSFWER